MVADTPDIGAPFKNGVVGREIVHPEEALSTQLNGIWNKPEHGNPDWHLDNHGETSTHWAYTIFGVERHHLLLFLHLVFRLVILLGSLFEFGFEHAHLGR